MSASIHKSAHFAPAPLLQSEDSVEAQVPQDSGHTQDVASCWSSDHGPSFRRQSVKGSLAKFNFQNPRFINAPIAHLDSREKCNTVKDCFEWSSVEERCSKESVDSIKRRNSPSEEDKEM